MVIYKCRVLKKGLFVLLVCIAITTNVYGATKICYRGIRSGKALLNVNGRLVQLAPGQSSKNGVEVVAANKETVIVKVDGKRYQYKKNMSRGEILAEEVKLSPARNGNYMANGSINGNSVVFLVDTGASFVAMNKNLARKLKIKPGNQKVQMQTASGTEFNYLVMLDTVSVGGINVNNIPAVISNHDYPKEPLLGMSFLKHVGISQVNGQMVLKNLD